jgi:hypothetical protein
MQSVEKSLAEFAARTPRKQSNHFFAGSPGEKILLSLLVCPQGARGRLQSPFLKRPKAFLEKIDLRPKPEVLRNQCEN